MGQEVERREFTREDRTRYREKVRQCLDVFARMLRESRFDVERPMTGLEVELNLVDEHCDPAMKNAEALEAIADPDFVTELGQFNLEINVAPRRLSGGGMSSFESDVRDSLNAAEEKARQVGAHMVQVGILPTLQTEHMQPETLSANPRYRLLNDQIFAARGEDLEISIRGRRPAPGHLRQHHARGGLHVDAAAHCRSAPTTSRRTGTPRRRSPASSWRSAPTRRSCSARSCGPRPGSRCSSRRPTPAARS